MKYKLETIIKQVTDADGSHESPSVSGRFHHEQEDHASIAENLNAAFLISLSGETHRSYSEAVSYLNRYESDPAWEKVVRFYQDGLELIHAEVLNRCYDDASFEKDFNGLYSWITDQKNLQQKQATVEKIRRLFFPEGVSLCEDREEKIDALREKRKIGITGLNPSPIGDPARELLITSNILVTTPPVSKETDELPVSPYLKERLKRAVKEKQMYWYDHPIPVGIAPEQNEVLYGLEGLDRAVEIEKQRGIIDEDARVTCVLSVSVTHKGLQRIAREYLEDEFRKEKNIKHLDVYIFTEADTERLVEDILLPAVQKYSYLRDKSVLQAIIGVDGEYGRHYSFLKAIAAFWQVFINRGMKGTFKIDLDQVFPQKELIDQSGSSAFEHFRTPLWGARGIDSSGNSVELGMIAGALVNQKDIVHSLFTPDVCFPPDQIRADELIFSSNLPQALSTESEMMTRYSDDAIDGKSQCIQRIHVTGGTCGILINSLRNFRPFTPSFIGRAEDQAYILSVLFDGGDHKLRYVHKDGLIMRHDKEAFAEEAIKMAAPGKIIGDYIRILMFSHYVRALPWTFEEIKDAIDPFTGCFVSRIPVTVVYLRFAMKAASFFINSSEDGKQEGLDFLLTGVRRLHEAIGNLTGEQNPLIEQFSREKEGWNIYYDILEELENKMNESDPFALELQQKAEGLVQGCLLNFNKG